MFDSALELELTFAWGSFPLQVGLDRIWVLRKGGMVAPAGHLFIGCWPFGSPGSTLVVRVRLRFISSSSWTGSTLGFVSPSVLEHVLLTREVFFPKHRPLRGSQWIVHGFGLLRFAALVSPSRGGYFFLYKTN